MVTELCINALRSVPSSPDPSPGGRREVRGVNGLSPIYAILGRIRGLLQFGAYQTHSSMTRKIFVTTALPYANGSFHIGHIMEYIQADIWVRFQRMQGREVHFVCADDAHGAPIMIAAEKAGLTPQEIGRAHV